MSFFFSRKIFLKNSVCILKYFSYYRIKVYCREYRLWKKKTINITFNFSSTDKHSMHACMLSHLSCFQIFVTPWTVACQAPLSVGFSRQEYWSGVDMLSSREALHNLRYLLSEIFHYAYKKNECYFLIRA